MKGKGGAMDRRSSARWRVLVLCAFSFGLGMLFTDRWVSPSPSLYYYLFFPKALDPALRFLCAWGSWGSSAGVMAAVQ